MSTLAVIPARGGSKRIPRKNIRDFCGKPMIAWSIETARRSGLFDAVIVSTDDAEIAEVARAWGAEVPFLRPAELSDDRARTRLVIAHAIEAFAGERQAPEYTCCIYATAPFLREADLARGFDLLRDSDAQFAYSVVKYPYPIQRALRINREGRVEMINPDHMRSRSQEMEEAYHDAAQFYWGRSRAFADDSLRIPSPASVPVVLPSHRVQDIDTPEDWVRAEWMFKAMQNEARSRP